MGGRGEEVGRVFETPNLQCEGPRQFFSSMKVCSVILNCENTEFVSAVSFAYAADGMFPKETFVLHRV
jgi:hypothetical protein